jgi:hypothetical protein
MLWMDSVVLNLTEGCCHRFQRLTGRTNVWLAFQLTNLSVVVYFLWAGISFWSTVPRAAFAVFCGVLLYVLAQTVFKVPIGTLEESAYRRVAKGLRNPRRLRDAPLRIPFLTLSIVFSVPWLLLRGDLEGFAARISPSLYRSALLGYSLIVLTTIVLYLLACDPLSPSAARLTAWWRAWISARARLLANHDSAKLQT